MKHRSILCAAAGAALFIMAGTGFAAAQEGSCATPGTVRFTDFAASRADIVPSVHRQLSGLGRLAQQSGCQIFVTCVLNPSDGGDQKKARMARCNAARQALASFEPRGAIRSALTRSYKPRNVEPSSTHLPGAVYVTLQ